MTIVQSLNKQLDFQYEAIIRLLEPVSNRNMGYVPENKKWSVLQEFAHVASYHSIFISRIESILDGKIEIEKYIPDSDPLFIEWQLLSKDELLKKFIANRTLLKSILTKLKLSDLKINTSHQVYGSQTLEQWLHFFIYHEGHHIFSMQRKCSQLAEKGFF